MPLDVYEGDGDQPHRWRVTNDAAVPEILADSGEGYTEERGAIEGAGHTLEQLLRHHPDAPRIVSEWFAELADRDRDLLTPEQSIFILGSDVPAHEADVLTDALRRWLDETGLTGTVRR